MKVPKRLPESFAEALATSKELGQEILDIKMLRFRGGASFKATTASSYSFSTIECLLYVLRGRFIREETHVHVRSWDVIEKALAVREAQLKAWMASEESNDWLKGVAEDASKAV
mgnify:CR=1 FL=1